MTNGKEKCLVSYCKSNGAVRGLCVTHYNYLTKVMKHSEGKMTWEELERSGKVLPKKHESGKGNFLAWLKE